MVQLSGAFSRALTAVGRRFTAVVVALLIGIGSLAVGGSTASAATKAPTGLSVAASGSTTLDASWKAVAGAPRYRVAYATKSSMSGAKYKRVTDPSVQLAGLTPGQRYYVKVRVITAGGKSLSSYSKAVSATTSEGYGAPAGLKVSDTGRSSVSLAWKAAGSGVTYRVQQADNASMSDASYVRTTATSTTIGGLDPATSYWFKVRVIDSDGENLSPYSTAVSGRTDASASSSSSGGSAELRVATFNVKCFNCKGTQPNERSWWERRGDVVRDIRSQDVDVLGVQEASQAWLPDEEGGKGQDLSQFEDLRNRLGGSWELANDKRNNCVKAKTPSGCDYKDQGASKGTRILFDSSTVELLDQGSKQLTAPSNERFMAWAIFRQRSTGKRFFFATAHLEPNKDWDLHVKEATEVAQEVAEQNPDDLPTFITGDMNAHKNTLNDDGERENPVAKVIVNRYGYVDPLGNASGSTTDTPGATVQRRINTPLSSYNDFKREPSPNYFGRRPNGTYIDYIFTSKRVAVLEWENVAHLDADHNYVGQQASDHNMQRATVVLP